jgi:hypothetical protein
VDQTDDQVAEFKSVKQNRPKRKRGIPLKGMPGLIFNCYHAKWDDHQSNGNITSRPRIDLASPSQ